MDPSNSWVKKPEVTVFGIWLEAVNWFCCHCLFYAHLKSFFSIQSKWLLCKYNMNVHNYHLWSEHFFGHSLPHRWRFCCVRWSFVHFFSLNVRIFFFSFFFLLNTNSSCKTVPGIRLERSSSWGDRQALISVACPDGVEGDRRQIAEVSPKT